MTLKLLYIPELFGVSIEVYFILFIISIPTFYFWEWLFKKYLKIDKTRRISTWIATLIATPLIYVGFILLLLFSMTYTPSKDFDKLQWLADKEGRFQMADDIIDSKMLIGKDTSEVKKILGEPTRGMSYANTYVYDMGMGGGGLGFLFHNLIVQFDNNKAVSVEHKEIRD